ncbi:Mor transcription activator family protein [Algiphilus sp.]|uniref:Mor transcription activator family protein n=1 Tax=Algiphilus sp. TaxID=1872431 RepID=UPI0025BCAEEB|nr:Mor transcription activator family protein [Algiphilus sp.]MCK5772014.1 hypothetical protein [Algiphilus sp.]
MAGAPAKQEEADLLRQFLPPKLLEIAEVVGSYEAAIRLSEHYPGVRLHIPHGMHARHPIALAIGLVAAERLSKRYAPETITVPKAARYARALRNAQIMAEMDRGASGRAVALRYGVHENHVYALRARELKRRQGDLFESKGGHDA